MSNEDMRLTSDLSILKRDQRSDDVLSNDQEINHTFDQKMHIQTNDKMLISHLDQMLVQDQQISVFSDQGINQDLFIESVIINPIPPEDLPVFSNQYDLLPTVGDGRIEQINVNGHQDYYLYGPNDYIKIGLRANWGASIVYWGLNQQNANTIDQNDTGRNLQIAMYDSSMIRQGCAYNASCLDPNQLFCPNSIRYLGWNPVQGGNRCNEGPTSETIENIDRKLIATTIPYQWNPDWQASQCEQDSCYSSEVSRAADVRFVQEIRFVDTHIAEIKMVVFNESNQDHMPTGQEMPTLYGSFGAQQPIGSTPDLYRVFNSERQEIVIDEEANDQFFHKSFSSNGWASLQNADLTYGVALYYENELQRFDGWQRRSEPSKFNNIRSEFIFGLQANGYVIARAYLILGALDTITQLAQFLKENLPPFGNLDWPTNDISVNPFDPLIITGWTLDNESVSMIEIQINGTQVYAGSIFNERSDVCAVWPGYRQCPQVGFSVPIDISSLAQWPGPHLVDIYAIDERNQRRLIDRKRFMIE